MFEEEQVGLNEKAPTCGGGSSPFAEPSDGLEPSTPSLPSLARCRSFSLLAIRHQEWESLADVCSMRQRAIPSLMERVHHGGQLGRRAEASLQILELTQ
jgi:hypothetical protein